MARYVDTKQGKDDVSDMEMLYSECIIRLSYQNRSELATLYKEQRDRLSTALKEDVAPVVHAHWEIIYESSAGVTDAKCSNCGYESLAYENDVHTDENCNYCPCCGAKMDER